MRRAAARVEPLEARTLLAAWYVSAVAATPGNGSPASPFRTIQQAANVVNPGDDVLIAPGTYNERVRVTRPGTAAAPITFRRDGAGAATVVPTVGVAMWDGAVTIAASNVTFDGVDVRDSTWYGYNIEGTTAAPLANVTVRNAHTLNTYASGVFAGRARGVSVLNCRIQNACISPNPAHNVHECITVGETDGFLIAGNEVWNSGVVGVANGGEGIDAKGSSKNGVIRDNRVHDLVRLGIYLDAGSKQGTAATDANPMSNITVTGNVVRHTAGGIVIASELGGLARDLIVTNNLVHDCREDGIAVVAWAANGPRSGILIANNTVYRNGFGNNSPTWGGGINLQTTNYTDVRIRNNIVSDNESWQIARTASPTQPSGQLTVTNNLSWGPALSYWNPVIGAGGIQQDPRFVDAASRDLRLQPTSPAINLGTASEAPTIDLTGAPRHAAPDAGAYEYVPPAPGAITLSAASDTGVIGDSRTRLNNASPASAITFTVAGTVAGAAVRVFAGTTLIGTATAAGTATAVTTSGDVPLADGVHAITATQTFAGAPSAASGSLTLTVDAARPTLVGAPVINAGASAPASRSQIRTITWTFSEPLAVGLGHFTLANRDTGAAVSLASRAVTVSGNQATLQLDRYGVDGTPQLFLADGNYELALSPVVADAAGNGLDANGDGTPGETPRLRFFKLLGDFTGDRRVTNADYLVWKNSYNQPVGPAGSGTDAALDLNASGHVSNADYLIWKQQYNRRLAPLDDGLSFT